MASPDDCSASADWVGRKLNHGKMGIRPKGLEWVIGVLLEHVRAKYQRVTALVKGRVKGPDSGGMSEIAVSVKPC